jgi:hypothetical protein
MITGYLKNKSKANYKQITCGFSLTFSTVYGTQESQMFSKGSNSKPFARFFYLKTFHVTPMVYDWESSFIAILS